MSPGATSTSTSKYRFRLFVFLVRMWRACECPRLILPVAVRRKRFCAPLCVFSFGILLPFESYNFGFQILDFMFQANYHPKPLALTSFRAPPEPRPVLLGRLLSLEAPLVQPDLPALTRPPPAEARCSRHSGSKRPASLRLYVSSAQRS